MSYNYKTDKKQTETDFIKCVSDATKKATTTKYKKVFCCNCAFSFMINKDIKHLLKCCPYCKEERKLTGGV